MSLTQTAAPAALYPPTVPPLERTPNPLRHLVALTQNPLRAMPGAVYEKPLVTFGGRRAVLAWVMDPDLIETVLLRRADIFPKTPVDRRILKPALGEGLLSSEGETWRWQRKLASPLFRHTEVLSYVPAMVAAATGPIARWRAGPPGAIHAIDEDMTDATFAVITATILAGCAPSDGEIIKSAGRAYLDPISWEIVAGILKLPEGIWHPGRGRMRRAANAQRAAVGRVIAARRAKGALGQDLLGRLLEAQRADTGAGLRDEELVDNLTTFLTAGHETTAKTLMWALYLLARAPECQAAVRDEIATVSGGAPIAGAHVGRLSLTQRVIKEAMRLYPPAPLMTRVATEAVELGGERLSAGTLVIIPVYAVHRHRALWEDADRFDPDRFRPEAEAARPRTQFMPFGFGPRSCIGTSFALIEATALLATFIRAARFDWDGTHLPEPLSRITLRPAGGMPLRVTPLPA